MRPILALYIGGMGSREKNFYNAIVRRYGFEDAAQEVQDLYLEGKKDEAAAALPDELIDRVTLCGPAGPRARPAAGVRRGRGRDPAGHPDGLHPRRAHRADAAAGRARRGGRIAAGAPRRRFFLGAFGDAGHAFPMIALGTELARRGHAVTLETWGQWQAHVEAAGMTFAAAPEFPVFPRPGEPLKPY